jgi:hypothetical protein
VLSPGKQHSESIEEGQNPLAGKKLTPVRGRGRRRAATVEEAVAADPSMKGIYDPDEQPIEEGENPLSGRKAPAKQKGKKIGAVAREDEVSYDDAYENKDERPVGGELPPLEMKPVSHLINQFNQSTKISPHINPHLYDTKQSERFSSRMKRSPVSTAATAPKQDGKLSKEELLARLSLKKPEEVAEEPKPKTRGRKGTSSTKK